MFLLLNLYFCVSWVFLAWISLRYFGYFWYFILNVDCAIHPLLLVVRHQSKQPIPVFHLPSLSSTSSGGKTFPSQPRNVIFPACRGSFHTGPQTAPVQVGGHCLIKPAELHHLRKSSTRSSGHMTLRNSRKISFTVSTAEGLSVGLRRSLILTPPNYVLSWG